TDATAVEHGIECAPRRIERVVLRQTFGTQFAAIDAVLFVPANRHRSPVSNADEHAATDGAVSARRTDPAIGDARGRNISSFRIVGISVLFAQRIQSQQTLDVQAASLRKNPLAMLFGR